MQRKDRVLRYGCVATIHLQVPWEEKVIRAVVVYAFLLLALRLFGRRELGQFTAFDLVVLLTLSNIRTP